MKSGHIICVTCFILLLGISALGAGVKDSAKVVSPVKKLFPQTLCPVMGDAIDSAIYSDIQGQRVYYCCKKCEKRLMADPEKYFKQAAEDGILFENVQKSCPVTGKPIDKKYFVDYVGRRIYFSSAICISVFGADPGKYLKVLESE